MRLLVQTGMRCFTSNTAAPWDMNDHCGQVCKLQQPHLPSQPFSPYAVHAVVGIQGAPCSSYCGHLLMAATTTP